MYVEVGDILVPTGYQVSAMWVRIQERVNIGGTLVWSVGTRYEVTVGAPVVNPPGDNGLRYDFAGRQLKDANGEDIDISIQARNFRFSVEVRLKQGATTQQVVIVPDMRKNRTPLVGSDRARSRPLAPSRCRQ